MSQGPLERLGWVLWCVVSLLWEVVAGVFGIPLRSPMQSALKKKAKAATTYSEWVAIARQLDDLEGFQSWRLEEEPRYMNSEGLVGHIQLLIDAKKKGDTETLLSVLSTGLHRSAYGILNPNLYVYRSGTKAVIETYNSLLVYLIRSLARDTSVTAYTRYATLLELSRVCSNTALVFNGGMVLGPFHVGVAKALWKANLLPRIFYGGRTGSVVAALLCCKKDLSEVFEVDNLNYPAFSGKDVGALQRRSVRFWMEGHLMDIAVLAQFIKDNVGDLTFLEAYNLTGRVLNIEFTPDTDDANCTAAPPVRLLNYLTAPNVLVYSAAAASFASSPLFFGRYPLMAKDLAGRIVRYDPPVMGAVGRRADGKIDGLKRLRELFHIKCFIVSECSATRLPFLRLSGRTSLLARLGHAISEEWWRFVSFIISFTPLKKYIWVLFSNDDSDADDVIKLFPASSWTDIAGVFNLPTMRQIHECVLRGERQVWPSLKRIQEHVAPELALNDALSELSRADPKISWENDNPYSW